ncbi:unnamed protein product [Rhizophagus irregularis]|nr:unnamed protein product [Rhizophagus irregularis]
MNNRNLLKRHDQLHRTYPNIPLFELADDSCRICHPVLTIPDRYFLRFWNWYSLETPTLSYSAKTVQYFYEYSQGTILRQQYLIRKLISSIRYQNASFSYDKLAIKIYTARERFQNFNLDPFVHYQHEDELLGYELSFITPPTSPILQYPRNLLFINEPLYLEYLFEDENMSNLQNNQALTEQITEIRKKVTGNRPPPRSDSRNPNAPSEPNRTIVCYTCGEAGHVSRRCPNNPASTSSTNPVVAPIVTTTPPISTASDTQNLVQKLLKQLNSATYPAQRRSQTKRAEPYSRPVISEEEEPLQPIDIPTAPHETSKTVEPIIAAETAETSSKAIERTTVNIAAKKKKAPVVKKKKKINLQLLISLHVPPYSMVDDIKNQQARITFGQLLEVAPKCRSELIRGI